MLDINVNLPVPGISLGKKKREGLLKLVRDATCYFQEHFIDYSIVASDKHKSLRLCFDGRENDLEQLHALAGALINHCNQKLEAAFTKAATYTKEYFSLDGRNRRVEPRICVKTSYQGQIADLFRDRGARVGEMFPIAENTGFESIALDGKYFLCNNIPIKAKTGHYKNKRLDPLSVERYSPPSRFSRIRRLRSDDPIADPQWESCWDVGTGKRPAPESCYKSTLIIPMTLISADVGADLRKILRMDMAYEKRTYGYLCVDHRTTGFFREPDDVHIGYFFADMLSLYMINRMNYIDNSETFKQVYRKLRDSERIDNPLPFLLEERERRPSLATSNETD